MSKFYLTPTEIKRIAGYTYLLKTDTTHTVEIEVREGGIGHTVNMVIDKTKINVTDYEAW